MNDVNEKRKEHLLKLRKEALITKQKLERIRSESESVSHILCVLLSFMNHHRFCDDSRSLFFEEKSIYIRKMEIVDRVKSFNRLSRRIYDKQDMFE